MKKALSAFIVSLFIFTGITAKEQTAFDSLQNAYKTARTDTDKVNLLNLMCRELRANNLSQSKQLADSALTISLKSNYKKGIAESYKNIGVIYSRQNDYQSALTNYLKALEICESISDKKATGGIYNNIGIIYKDLGIYDKAFDYFLKAVEISKALNNDTGLSINYDNIGSALGKMKKYPDALDYLNKSLEINRKLNDSLGIAVSHINIGEIYSDMGNYPDALDNFSKSLELFSRINEKHGILAVKMNIGKINIATGNIKQAKDNFLFSLDLANRLGLKESIRDCYKGLAEISEKMNDLNGALKYQKLYMQMKDSIGNTDISVRVNEMQTKYETEKKEKEIALKNQERELKQQAEIDKQKIAKRFWIGGVILLIILASVILDKYRQKQKSNFQLEEKNKEIANKNKEITDNINYAKKIQESVITPIERMKELLPNSFLFYRPKDIVSGDFYWAEKSGDKIIFAVADCTGHGVSGSLMTITCNNLLNDAVKLFTTPSLILDYVNKGLCKALHQTNGEQKIKDGMDIAICRLDVKTMALDYAGAFNPLWIIRMGQLIEIKADKLSIGNISNPRYTNHQVQLKTGDCIYLFSDGYPDQFGGEKGKKFKYKPFADTLAGISTLQLDQQEFALETYFNRWKGDLEQTDDVLVMGLKI
jgi:serine phosphatase RsbU (regulator of sigma subunit)/Tfp pilus assembly protein PilF